VVNVWIPAPRKKGRKEGTGFRWKGRSLLIPMNRREDSSQLVVEEEGRGDLPLPFSGEGSKERKRSSQDFGSFFAWLIEEK